MYTLSSLLLLENSLADITVRCAGKVKLVNDLQSANACEPMLVTLSGISIDEKLQLLKASNPMVVTVSGIYTLLRCELELNAYSGICIIPSSNIASSTFDPLNAGVTLPFVIVLIVVTPLGIVILFIPLPLNASP